MTAPPFGSLIVLNLELSISAGAAFGLEWNWLPSAPQPASESWRRVFGARAFIDSTLPSVDELT